MSKRRETFSDFLTRVKTQVKRWDEASLKDIWPDDLPMASIDDLNRLIGRVESLQSFIDANTYLEPDGTRTCKGCVYKMDRIHKLELRCE